MQPDFTGKRVTVVGMARSGIAAARALHALGAIVTITDNKPLDQLAEQVRRLGTAEIVVEAGGHPERIFIETDLVVLSPGVPKIAPVLKAQRHGVKVIGELELGWLLSDAAFAGITGTNGKSTVTTLVGLMLLKAGKRTLVAGNIGNALTEDVPALKHKDWIVVELSSFQLEDIETFRPAVAAILNVTQDHLDRYATIEEYSEAKARIFMNQHQDDVLVLNYDDPLVRAMAVRTRSRVVGFSRLEKPAGGAYVDADQLVVMDQRICGVDEIRIKGVHNLENAMAASAMAMAAGCPPEHIAAVLREFPGLEHRLEFVREMNGVSYINDSKGTNVGAVVKSVEGFDRPVIVIAGGYDKGSDFTPLAGLFREKVKLLVLIGKAADKMAKALGSSTETVFAKTLQDAVQLAHDRASAGDVVLLSPACASFDMFRDFEDRGRQFKEAVGKLTETTAMSRKQ
ncbi:MAG: UDP-N-acetylmuramoyl-L-alanine--D-glutamate ligase [Nitrospirota bacterium]|nr:UDP-N-acetylmuramoyl-L-alanine--D-glutamate ligase [Nitrospirota bacterium]